jgi:hypothetical protein
VVTAGDRTIAMSSISAQVIEHHAPSSRWDLDRAVAGATTRYRHFS